MSANTPALRPGTQRTGHHDHHLAIHSRESCHSCPHQPASHGGAAQPVRNWLSITPFCDEHKLSEQMWQVHADIEAEVSKLDHALRRTWLWLGGVLLPCAGFLVYVMANIR